MKHIFRIIIDILLFVAILNAWWPAALALGIIGVWFFGFYIEIILAGVAYDALFGMVHGMGWKGYVGTIGSVIILLAVKAVKSMMR